MSIEKGIRPVNPVLLRYLASADTRRAYLHRYKNIRVVRQSPKENYFAFDADARGGYGDLRADVYLYPNSRPMVTRLIEQNTEGYPSVTNIHITSYEDIETVVQVKDVVVGGGETEPVYSVRKQLLKNRHGIHWIWDSAGPLKQIEVYPEPSVKVDINHIDGSPEDPMITITASEEASGKYKASVGMGQEAYLVEVSDGKGTVFRGEAPICIDPMRYRGWLCLPGKFWRDTNPYTPTTFSFTGPIRK